MEGSFVLRHLPYNLEFEVGSCKQAAEARNIPLAQELKTLVLKGRAGIYVAHLPGNRLVNFGQLRRFEKNFSFASASFLAAYGLGYGSINPCNVRKMQDVVFKEVVCETVLEHSVMYTNDGTRSGTYLIGIPNLIKAIGNNNVLLISTTAVGKSC